MHPNMEMEWSQWVSFLNIHVSLEDTPGSLHRESSPLLVTHVSISEVVKLLLKYPLEILPLHPVQTSLGEGWTHMLCADILLGGGFQYNASSIYPTSTWPMVSRLMTFKSLFGRVLCQRAALFPLFEAQRAALGGRASPALCSETQAQPDMGII